MLVYSRYANLSARCASTTLLSLQKLPTAWNL